MYAVVVRACPLQRLFMLSLFEPPGAHASEWSRPVALGLPQGSALAFKEALILSDDEMSLLLGVGTRRLQDWPPDVASLDEGVEERLARCARLFAIALHVLEDRGAAVRWLKSPQRELGDFIPLLLAQTGAGARAAEGMLANMAHGMGCSDGGGGGVVPGRAGPLMSSDRFEEGCSIQTSCELAITASSFARTEKTFGR